MSTVIKGGTVVDTGGERDVDVVIGDDGRIEAVGEGLTAARLLDAAGCIVCPGLVDLHASLGEPGYEDRDTIETATRAAVLGGFTSVVAMPDTSPPVDCAAALYEVRRAAAGALCNVVPTGCVTVDRAGERLAPMAELAELGVRLFVDARCGVADGGLLRRALEYAIDLGVVIGQHCEDRSLAAGGHMHEGEWSSRLGIPGIAAEAEEVVVMRDLALARLTGARLHFQHLSTPGSVGMVAAARRAGVSVTAEVAAHHLLFTDADGAYDPLHKVHPPFRSADLVAQLGAAVADGAVDALVSDHEPRRQDDKEQPFDQAPPGAIGLETALATALTSCAATPAQLVAMFSWQPAAIAGIADHGRINEGGAADLCVFDPTTTWTFDPASGASRSANSPLAGRELRGRVRHTLVGGEALVVDGEAQR